ncbi:MAG TPA: hypothetical protein VL997_03555 [Dyella sp.]|nr:hypothetical protein [Dyella sp.]
MKKIFVVALLLFVSSTINASDRRIFSCDKAPLLSAFQKQLPDHILAKTADKPPKILSEMPHIAGSLYNRAGTDLVCVVIAIDATGKAQAAEVSYPAGVKLIAKEREQLLETQWTPAEQNGQPRPSLENMSFEFHRINF